MVRIRVRSIPIVLVAALAACGSSGAARGTSTTPPPGAPAAGARPAGADYSAESLCRRLDELSTRCPAFNLGRTERGKCMQMFAQIAGGSKDPEALKTPTTRCLVEQTECDQIVACMAALSDGRMDPIAGNEPNCASQASGRMLTGQPDLP